MRITAPQALTICDLPLSGHNDTRGFSRRTSRDAYLLVHAISFLIAEMREVSSGCYYMHS